VDCISEAEIAELDIARHKIWKIGGIGVDEGYGYGNISQRCSDNAAHFIISGSQTGHLENLTNTQYAKVTYWKIKNNLLFCQGKIQASSEALTHAVLYDINTDIQVVIHIHNNLFWKKNLNKLATSDEKAEYGTPEIAQSVRFLFTNKVVKSLPNIIIMGGHQDGILVFGESLAQATDFWLQISSKA
jgi:hypothetical protein